MNKLFRVFFSSTFTDFVEERNALHKTVFPKLKELCAARGARFQPIDLRWGIPNEAALQQSSLQICLDEIKRCQKVTFLPNYVVFLGERYGWCPPPAKIPKPEYKQISAYFSEEEKNFIEKWYKHDDNELCRLEDGSISTTYELQPRREVYREYAKWVEVEKKLHSILLQAARKSAMVEKQLIKYYASATHQEIIQGIKNVEGAENYVYCFIRKITKLPKKAKLSYIEVDSEKKKQIERVKIDLKQLFTGNLHEYSANFRNKTKKQEYLQKFCADVYNSLEQTILQELNKLDEQVQSPLEEEIHSHIEFGKERTKIFVGRADILDRVSEYAHSNDKKPFIIIGEPGLGKSALIAKVYQKLYDQIGESKVHLFLRFIGISSGSSNAISVLRSICEEIINKFELDWKEEIPFEYKNLNVIFRSILQAIPEDKKAIILVDALDQLSKRDKARDLDWIPNNLPGNVKLIATVATDDQNLMETIERKFQNSTYSLNKLTIENGSEVVNLLLNNSLRNLTNEQKKFILENFSANGSPLFLKLAFEVSRHWNSYDNLSSLKLGADVEGVIRNLLERLYQTHTREIVNRIFGYIVAARNGLTEDEILEVMSANADAEFFQWYVSQIYFDLPEEKLPWIVWARLYADIEPFITVRGVDNTSTIVFFHRQFNEFVSKHIINESSLSFNNVLARYFNAQECFYGINRKTPNYRKLSEVNFNSQKAEIWGSMEGNLSSLEFIDAKCRASMVDDLIDDFYILTENYQNQNNNQVLTEFQKFVQNQAHLLRKFAPKFPQFTAQQAINQPDKLMISSTGKSYLKSLKMPLLWFEWRNKPQEVDPSILTFTGHEWKVNSCTFSPDGNRILSASPWDKTIKLWDVETGEEIRTFSGHLGGVYDCKFSPDGSRIVSVSSDETIKLWDVETGTEISTFSGNLGRLNACAFSPNGNYILSASWDSNLRLWDVETGKEICTFTGHSGHVNSCVYSPDGKFVLSASSDNSIKLWDVETGEEIRTFIGHSSYVKCCAFSPDGNQVLSASYDNTLKLWDVETGTEISTFSGHSDFVNFCTISPDGTIILSASSDETLKLWDVETGEEIRTFIGHSSYVNCCAFSPDGTMILSASDDSTVKLWDVEVGSEIPKSTGHSDSVVSCAISPDGTRVVSASWDETLKLWDIASGSEIRTFIGHTSWVNCCTFSPDGTIILSASSDKTLKLWDVKTGAEIRSFTGHSETVYGCAFSPDGKRMVSASEDCTLKLWDVESGKEIQTLTGHSKWVQACTYSPDGTQILSVSGEIYDLSTKNTVMLWSVKTGKKIRTITENSSFLWCCAFSPDGAQALSGSRDGKLKLWNLKTGAEIQTFTGHTFEVYSCVFTQNGNWILSASGDKTIILWDVNSGKELMVFPTQGMTHSVSVSSNGSVVCGDERGSLYILQLLNCDRFF